MERNVRKGRVIVDGKRHAVEIGGERYYVPKECDPIMDPMLKAVAGKDVEVLYASNQVLAVRVSRKVAQELEIKPIITCYLCPPELVFAPDIMEKIQPIITESLIESKYLDADVAEQLMAWQRQNI
jgi:hypothetical protein